MEAVAVARGISGGEVSSSRATPATLLRWEGAVEPIQSVIRANRHPTRSPVLGVSVQHRAV